MIKWHCKDKCIICLPVKNCNKYLPKIFDNIKQLQTLFNITVVFGYDESNDDSLDTLINYQKTSQHIVVIIQNDILEHRTWRLANIRNKFMEYIKNNNSQYFIMMDSDDACNGDININIIDKYLKRYDWDCLTFNRSNYYDIWALQYEPFIHQCYGFGKKGGDIPQIMRKDIVNKLRKLKSEELFECYSAFNGFGIYRTNKFMNIRYDGNKQRYFSNKRLGELVNLLKNKWGVKGVYIDPTSYENCEHIGFHINAIRKNNAKIMITKDILFN